MVFCHIFKKKYTYVDVILFKYFVYSKMSINIYNKSLTWPYSYKGLHIFVWHTGLSPPALMQWTLAWYEHPGLRPSQTHSIAKPLYTWFQEEPETHTQAINE